LKKVTLNVWFGLLAKLKSRKRLNIKQIYIIFHCVRLKFLYSILSIEFRKYLYEILNILICYYNKPLQHVIHLYELKSKYLLSLKNTFKKKPFKKYLFKENDTFPSINLNVQELFTQGLVDKKALMKPIKLYCTRKKIKDLYNVANNSRYCLKIKENVLLKKRTKHAQIRQSHHIKKDTVGIKL